MKDLLTVAIFTTKDMVKRKSFIISNIIILLLIVIGFNIPNIISSIKGDSNGDADNTDNTKILIVDSENIFEGSASMLNNMELGYEAEVSNQEVSFDTIKERIEKEEISEALVITRKERKN